MNKKLEEENEKLKEALHDTSQALEKSRRNAMTPKMWIGGGLGVFVYFLIKSFAGYGRHGGDIIGLFLLGFLPGAALAGGMFGSD